MMAVPIKLPNIANLGLASRDVIEMPEDQEETPHQTTLLENFGQAALMESPIPKRHGKVQHTFPDISKRTSDTNLTAAIYLDQMERIALANLLAHSRTPS